MTTSLAVPLESYSLTPCVAAADLADAAEFRHRVFRERSGLDFDERAEEELDRSAVLIGALRRDGELVSTARATPFPSPWSALHGHDLSSVGADTEVGRLAAAPGEHSALDAFVVLVLGSLWMTRYTTHTTYISYTNPKLIRLYTEVGALDTGQMCTIPGRSTEYHIVVGTYEDCHRSGREKLGLSHRDALGLIGAPPVAARSRAKDTPS